MLEEQVESDARDGFFSFLENLMYRVQEDFDELIGKDNKKNLIYQIDDACFCFTFKNKSRHSR